MEKVFEINGIKFYTRNNVSKSEVAKVVRDIKSLCERESDFTEALEVEIYE